MKLENSKIIFLGDSITEGHGTSSNDKIYHQIIADRYGLSTAYNCGIGGTRIAKQIHPLSFPFHISDLYFDIRVDVLPNEADAIVVFGGTNDHGHGDALMGEPDSEDIYTFCGGLNRLIASLKTKFPDSKLVFLTPLRKKEENVPNKNGYILKDYVDSIIKVTKNHNIPVINLFKSDIVDPFDKEILPDGTHPSDKGHFIMADYIGKKLLEI